MENYASLVGFVMYVVLSAAIALIANTLKENPPEEEVLFYKMAIGALLFINAMVLCGAEWYLWLCLEVYHFVGIACWVTASALFVAFIVLLLKINLNTKRWIQG